MSETQFVSYDNIASEYYDRTRHPTCANFREASACILKEWLQRYGVDHVQICEVGAGNSLLAELLVAMNHDLDQVLISDLSPGMLEYSKKWVKHGAKLLLNKAEMIPVASESLGLLVSLLGDPYNEPAFWAEAYRTLRPGGLVFFTTPAHEWAKAFRSQSEPHGIISAEFELRDGRKVRVPSWIYPVEQQVALIRSKGLEVREVKQVLLSALTSEDLSPKLLVTQDVDINVVTGYLCMKPDS